MNPVVFLWVLGSLGAVLVLAIVFALGVFWALEGVRRGDRSKRP